jgi:hypothetical protein
VLEAPGVIGRRHCCAPDASAARLVHSAHMPSEADDGERWPRSGAGRGRWTSFVADTPPGASPVRGLHEQSNPDHRPRVEHDAATLLVHLSDEDGRGWTTIAVDRATRRWSVAQGRRQSDTSRHVRRPLRALTRRPRAQATPAPCALSVQEAAGHGGAAVPVYLRRWADRSTVRRRAAQLLRARHGAAAARVRHLGTAGAQLARERDRGTCTGRAAPAIGPARGAGMGNGGEDRDG